jgi:hypothetical protein
VWAWRPVVSARLGWRRPTQRDPGRPVSSSVSLPPTPAGTGAHRAGAGRRKANHRPWLRPIRRGIGASSCATKSAPSWNSCVEPSPSCAGNSIKRTTPSESVDSANRTQARHSGSSTKPGRGTGAGCGRRYATARCSNPASDAPWGGEVAAAQRAVGRPRPLGDQLRAVRTRISSEYGRRAQRPRHTSASRIRAAGGRGAAARCSQADRGGASGGPSAALSKPLDPGDQRAVEALEPSGAHA